MRKTCIVFIMLFLVTAFVPVTNAQEVFLWQHDNRLTQADRVFNATITATDAIARTLDQLDVNYERSTSLPELEELQEYDLVMTALSFYCPG